MEWQQVQALITSHIDGDEERFRGVALQVVANERLAKHHHAADGLERALRHRPASMARMVALAQRDAPSFVRTQVPTRGMDGLILHDDCRARLESVLAEHAQADLLAPHGLLPASRLLFHGPPGNGKTSCASAVAHAIGMPLHAVRVDGLVTSYLGDTLKHVRQVFDFAEKAPGVLFFDEFDALARDRRAHGDVAEMQRVVNSFLQILDGYPADRPLIVATNILDVIDPAVRRRFDEEIVFEAPTPAMAQRLVDRILGPMAGARVAAHGASMAAIERGALRARKAAVLHGRSTVDGPLLEGFLRPASEAA